MDNKERASHLRKEHSRWRSKNFRARKGFFPVFEDFKGPLSQLSGGSVSLFLYIGLHANNVTGECYHDVTTIARYFNKSPRTITSWFRELEEYGLVERIQLTFNGASHTFIRPYASKEVE